MVGGARLRQTEPAGAAGQVSTLAAAGGRRRTSCRGSVLLRLVDHITCPRATPLSPYFPPPRSKLDHCLYDLKQLLYLLLTTPGLLARFLQ